MHLYPLLPSCVASNTTAILHCAGWSGTLALHKLCLSFLTACSFWEKSHHHSFIQYESPFTKARSLSLRYSLFNSGFHTLPLVAFLVLLNLNSSCVHLRNRYAMRLARAALSGASTCGIAHSDYIRSWASIYSVLFTECQATRRRNTNLFRIIHPF